MGCKLGQLNQEFREITGNFVKITWNYVKLEFVFRIMHALIWMKWDPKWDKCAYNLREITENHVTLILFREITWNHLISAQSRALKNYVKSENKSCNLLLRTNLIQRFTELFSNFRLCKMILREINSENHNLYPI